MEMLHHQLWITQAVNVVFGPIAAAILRAFGREVPSRQVIPDYLAMLMLITLALTIFSLFVRSRLSVENPGRLQIVLEDFVNGFHSLLDDFVGPKGRRYLPLVGSMFLLIWLSNLAGLVPGLMAPTSNLNVTLGCALTVWVFYHVQGVKEQGLVAYLKHFAVPPGSPVAMAPLMLIIELISHVARVMSLSLAAVRQHLRRRARHHHPGEPGSVRRAAADDVSGPADRHAAGVDLRDPDDGVSRSRGCRRTPRRGASLTRSRALFKLALRRLFT